MSGRAVRTRVGVNGTFVIGGLFLCGLCAQGCVSDVGELCGMLFGYVGWSCWVYWIIRMGGWYLAIVFCHL